MEKPQIVIEKLSKRFGKKDALVDINLQINRGDYIVILGPTGAGKTTLLKIIVGLIPASKGSIYKDGELMDNLPPEERNLAYLPQTEDYSLFPYMNVWHNSLFSPKMRGEKSIDEINAVGNEVLDLVNLRHRYAAFPHELSGGMKQRVALARAIAADADVFLLDEPLRALDARLRIILRTEIKKLVTDLAKTTFHVTHDQEEALAVADQILIINNGEVVQIGSPEEIYQRPITLFSAFFFGVSNLIPAKLKEQKKEKMIFNVGNHIITCFTIHNGKSESVKPPKDEFVLTVKAEKIGMRKKVNDGENSTSKNNEVDGRIIETHFLGKWGHVEVEIEGFPKRLTVAIPSTELDKFEINTEVSLTIDSKDIVFFNEPWVRIKELEDN
ncbi:MAG: ABC transporter ATP-binding protein [Candidatus Hodarchaeales archaeon]|jgi:ABC-type Fe3+/spermidine/putrescine transport system ATPase subunit